VINGATTVWERWDSYTREHGFNGLDGNQNASMNSFSHYAFGAITAWMFRDLAGIDTEGVGYRRIVIRPGVPSATSPFRRREDVAEIYWVKARYDSVRGRIASSWRKTVSGLQLDVTIPANTTARVEMPGAGPDAIREGGKALSRVKEVKVLGQAGGRVLLEVGSGDYRFTND
jgi:alpha-L-rhamnosidase